jgi:hypothetical protein
MPKTTRLDDWLDVLAKEYLGDYVLNGGSSIKFAVASDELRPQVIEKVEALCSSAKFVVLKVDAAQVRVHMPQEIYLSMARQIEWPCLTRAVVLNIAEERRYRVDGIDPADNESVFEAIAERNGVDSRSVHQDLRPAIQDRVCRNPGMMRDFRAAMTKLCSDEGGPDHPLVGWLTGARIGTVRDYLIYTRIDRTTARHFIESTAKWVRLAGYSGTVLLLDNSRVTLARNPKDGLRYYTRGMVIDHFQMLREFIDDIDRIESTMIVVATSEQFGESPAPRGTRSMGLYDALNHRLLEDVRDKRLANPVASLVRLNGSLRNGAE